MSKNWRVNCIKGRLGETIAVAHFTAMGATVDRTGIERTAPMSVAGLSNARRHGDHLGDLLGGLVHALPAAPDLLVSKRWTDLAGTVRFDTLFVEVKWRRCADLAWINADCTTAFRDLLAGGRSILLYVVCWDGVRDGKLLAGDARPAPFAVTRLLGPSGDAGWSYADARLSPGFFAGSGGVPSFGKAYRTVVVRAMEQIRAAGM